MSKLGDCLMVLKRPFVHCLNARYKQVYCDYCLKENCKLLKCSSCKYMFYCDSRCQRDDWPIHKIECKHFAMMMPSLATTIDDELIRLYFRVLIQVKNNQNNSTDEVGLKTFETLVDHYEDLVKDLKRMNAFFKCIETLKSCIGSSFFSSFNSKQLISFFGKMVINSFSISNFDLSKSIGSGIYLSASSLNHSCYPNCVIVYDGVRLYVKLIRDLKDEREEVVNAFVCYVDEIMDRKSRQEYLMNNYYFACKCEKCSCSSNVNLNQKQQQSRFCINCQSASAFIYDESQSQYKCLECGGGCVKSLVKPEEISKLLHESKIEPVQNAIEKLKEASRLDEQSWAGFVKLSEHLMDLYANEEGNHEKAVSVAVENLIENYLNYFPPFHPTIGFLYLKIAKLLNNLEEYEKAQTHLKMADSILRLVYKNTTQHEILKIVDELKRNCNKN